MMLDKLRLRICPNRSSTVYHIAARKHCATRYVQKNSDLRQLVRQRVNVVPIEGVVSIEVFLWSVMK